MGRGVFSPSNLEVINKLAEKCNDCVVDTRAVVEENIIDKEFQVWTIRKKHFTRYANMPITQLLKM